MSQNGEAVGGGLEVSETKPLNAFSLMLTGQGEDISLCVVAMQGLIIDLSSESDLYGGATGKLRKAFHVAAIYHRSDDAVADTILVRRIEACERF